MKKLVIVLSLSFIVIGGAIISCQSNSIKEEKTNDKAQHKENYLADTQSDSVKVLQDTISVYQKFITESEDRINLYEKEIASLKIKIAEEKESEKADLEKKLADLEQKNKKLKSKIIDYKNNQVENWVEIQKEFSKDLDDLGGSIAGFFKKD